MKNEQPEKISFRLLFYVGIDAVNKFGQQIYAAEKRRRINA